MRILIAEDDPVSRRVLTVQLIKWGHEVVVTENGIEAWETLRSPNAPKLAILDWMMPGMDGVEVCRRLRQEQVDSPVYLILLTALSLKENVIAGLEGGADDYLTKPFDRQELRVRVQAGVRIVELQSNLCERVKELQEAVAEKERAEEALRNLTLTDDMTGLYNHRGFFTLAKHIAKMARRNKQNSVLIYADMDGLKQINDNFGHSVGSLAIKETAEILRRTFRDCDLVSRFGGDEFVILSPNVNETEIQTIVQRLRTNLDEYNKSSEHPFELSLSLGAVPIDHSDKNSFEKQIAVADSAMYLEKRERKMAKELAFV